MKVNLGVKAAAPGVQPAQEPAPAPTPFAKPGGFAVKPASRQDTIIDAVANPAPAPASARTVRTAPIEEPSVGEALREDASVPEELDTAFMSLMKP
jgi:hypothetical protein